MSKFIRLTRPQNKKKMIKVSEDGKDVWYDTTPQVYTWAEKNYKEGDEVTLDVEKTNGVKTVVKVTGKGSGYKKETKTQEPASTNVTTTSSTAKTYNTSYSGDYMKPKTPEEAEAIKRAVVIHAATRAVNALAGQIDLNHITEVTLSLYDEFYKKISE